MRIFFWLCTSARALTSLALPDIASRLRNRDDKQHVPARIPGTIFKVGTRVDVEKVGSGDLIDLVHFHIQDHIFL